MRIEQPKPKKYQQLPEREWVELCIRESNYNTQAAAVLRKIHALSKKQGYCYSSHKYLAKNLNMSDRNLRRYLRMLEDDGVLWVEHKVGTKKQNHYRICSEMLRDRKGPIRLTEKKWKKPVDVEAMAKQLVAVTVLGLLGHNAITIVAKTESATADNGVLMGADTQRTHVDNAVLMGADNGVRQIDVEKKNQVLNNNRRDEAASDDDSNSFEPKTQNQKQNQEPENPFQPDSIESLMMNVLVGRKPAGFTEAALVPSINSPDASPWAPEGFGGAEAVPSMEVHSEIVRSHLDDVLEAYFAD